MTIEMTIGQSMLPEFDHEVAGARKTLERAPKDRFDWRPHPKSGTLVWLATHVANIPSWGVLTIEQDELDLMPGGVPLPAPPRPADAAALVAALDKNAAAARAALAAASDADLMRPWSLLRNGATIMQMPKIAVLRSMVFNHLIHHRAQLCVYLRLNDVAVPPLYGPSADEPANF